MLCEPCRWEHTHTPATVELPSSLLRWFCAQCLRDAEHWAGYPGWSAAAKRERAESLARLDREEPSPRKKQRS